MGTIELIHGGLYIVRRWNEIPHDGKNKVIDIDLEGTGRILVMREGVDDPDTCGIGECVVDNLPFNLRRLGATF